MYVLYFARNIYRRGNLMATTMVNTELKFNSSKECSEFLNNIYSKKTKPSNPNIARTLAGMKKIKTMNIDGKKYNI